MLFMKKNSSKSVFVSGWKHKYISIALIIRLLIQVFWKWGLFRGYKILRKYRIDKRNLFKNFPNRFYKLDKKYCVVSDLPPINSRGFVNYLIQDIEFVVFNKPTTLLFSIVCITSKCPFNCKYCYNKSQHSSKEKLSFETIDKLLDDLINVEVNSIYISGGEPMLRYAEMLKLVKKHSNKVSLWLLTTGYGVSQENALELKAAGLKGVMVSLDSGSKEKVNSVKCSDKAFDYAINAIGYFRMAGLIVTIDAVFSKDMIKEDVFSGFMNFVGDLGAGFVNCYTAKDVNGSLNADSLFSLEDYKTLEKLTCENQTGKLNTKMPIAWAPDIWEAPRGCMGGKLFIYVDPEGFVHHCPFSKTMYGNIMEQGISEIVSLIKSASPSVCRTMELLGKK